jgi:hypothetical protein
MPKEIDQCPHSFQDLTTAVMPAYMEQLKESIKSPFPAAWIREPGVGIVSLLRRLEKKQDFSACYVFLYKDEPLYVGISQGVVERLYQHLSAGNHYGSSLAYLMARKKYNPYGTRSDKMENPDFKLEFEASLRQLEQCTIALVEISNPLELHLFETYAAMELGTGDFNTFQTH